tara:strand:+ start:978 stop:1289 length:312 start_codon:yes stop_codon:yes gene_type:complete
MGNLVHLAEKLSKPQIKSKAVIKKKEVKPVPRKNLVASKPASNDRPATKKQRGWIYYNLKLSTYKVSISRADMSVLIERSQRSNSEKAKVKHRLLQMGAKETT